MEPKDREFMLKLSRKVGRLELDVLALQKKGAMVKLPVQQQPIAAGPTNAHPGTPQPECLIVSRYKITPENAEVIADEAAKVDEELRGLIVEFCKEAGIQELTIVFKERV